VHPNLVEHHIDAGFERLSAEQEHAYGVALRGRVIAHLWWDAAPERRAAAGWYLRDLRTPAVVRRLPVVVKAVDLLTADHAAGEDEWARAAEVLARSTTAAALGEVQYAIRDSPYENYDVHIGGVTHGTLAGAFPGLGLREVGGFEVVSGRLTNSELADVLGRVHSLGGTVTAVVRVRPELR
jgi:hypothetical protein